MRRRSCKAKIKHVDIEKAVHHAQRIGNGSIAYPCKFCGGWHVGRQSKKRLAFIKAKYNL
jgi:hypothetical protein